MDRRTSALKAFSSESLRRHKTVARAIGLSGAFFVHANRVANAKSIGNIAAEHEPLPAPTEPANVESLDKA
jgi:hypothetical protein